MADTVNDLILDLTIRHHVGVQRLSSTVLRKVIRILDLADADIVKQLQNRGPTLEGSVTSKRLQALLDSIREINRDAHVEMGKVFKAELQGVSRYEAEYQSKMFQSIFPVQIETVSPTIQSLNALVTEQPIEGRLLSELVEEMGQAKLRRLRDQIRIGMVIGETNEQIVRRIRGTQARNYRDGVMQMSRVSTERIVRTATNNVANVAREAFYEENTDLIKSVKWVATLDTRTCSRCMAQDGEVYKVGKGPRPPLHINCRCTTAPVTKSWQELGVDIPELSAGTRASMNGQVPDTLTFNAWLRKQPAAVQDEALGPTRGALFRRGGLSVDRFTDVRGNQITIEELRVNEAAAFKRAGLK